MPQDRRLLQEEQKKRRIEWLLHAGNNALLEAQELVAECYENGRETTRNDCKAFHWYKRATEKGSEIGKSKAELYEILRFYP